MPVTTATAEKGDIPVTVNALGTITPLATITVKSQIAGLLTEVAFQEGQMVQKGDLLALVDPRPYQHALEQAQGQLERDQALLKNAQLDAQRYKTLFAQDSIAKQQLDTQNALVLQYTGTVQTDQAQVDTAKLNLNYCYIRAPLTGRVGLRLVDPGNYISVGDSTGIAVITQMQPITAIFTVAEDNLPPILQRLRQNVQLPVTAYDRGLKTKLADGAVSSIDNQIDTTTGTVKLRAQFANKDEMLFPNQFVNIALLVNTIRDATVIPTAAVQRGAPGTFVYVVTHNGGDKEKEAAEKSKESWFSRLVDSIKEFLGEHLGSSEKKRVAPTVAVRPVKLGVSSGERIAVDSGLAPGDVVVTDGADRLKDGAPVIPSNSVSANTETKLDNAQQDAARSDSTNGESGAQHDQSGAHQHRRHRDGSGSGEGSAQ